jgi:short-subunit dehydrogenase
MKELGGRTAIVTGASRGIGPYIGQALFDRGMKVVLAARSARELEAVRERLDRSGQRTLAVVADVTSEEDRRRLLSQAGERFGAVDVLVNNAGLEEPTPYVGTAPERIRELLELNVYSLMRLTQLALPAMLARGSGQVVNLGSLAGLSPVPYNTVYATTKHAVVGFSQSLRYELAGTGVGVSVVCPGFVREAGMFTRYVAGGEDAGLAGTVSPREVADAVVAAIRHDRGRIVVTPALARSTPLLGAISPGAIYGIMRAGGVLKRLKETAERNAAERADAVAPAAGGSGASRPRKRASKAASAD